MAPWVTEQTDPPNCRFRSLWVIYARLVLLNKLRIVYVSASFFARKYTPALSCYFSSLGPHPLCMYVHVQKTDINLISKEAWGSRWCCGPAGSDDACHSSLMIWAWPDSDPQNPLEGGSQPHKAGLWPPPMYHAWHSHAPSNNNKLRNKICVQFQAWPLDIKWPTGVLLFRGRPNSSMLSIP